MNRIQLIDLNMSSEEEEMGGMMISRKVMQSRLGWLSTMVEPHMKQEAETTEIVKDIAEVHEEEKIEATQEDQPSHVLTSTETPKVTEAVKDEYIETSKHQEDVVEKHAEIEVTESVKDEYVDTSKEQEGMVEKSAELEVTEAVKDECEEISKEQKDTVEK